MQQSASLQDPMPAIQLPQKYFLGGQLRIELLANTFSRDLKSSRALHRCKYSHHVSKVPEETVCAVSELLSKERKCCPCSNLLSQHQPTGIHLKRPDLFMQCVIYYTTADNIDTYGGCFALHYMYKMGHHEVFILPQNNHPFPYGKPVSQKPFDE